LSTSSDYLGSYTLDDTEFGTQVTGTVDGETRLVEANALPDHDTGEFPNAGNPNTISEQDVSYDYPLEGTYTGDQTAVRTSGVAVNGVKFEPATAETVTCDSGETLRVEALQDIYDLGLDFNNAHVQPTGEYHYHGASDPLADAYSTGDDLVHVGFAADGFLIYYSISGAYDSGYALTGDARSGTDCVGSQALGGNDVEVAGTTADGTYTSDWVWSDVTGDLDECNGTEIDGTYAYLVTDTYPFISRCLKVKTRPTQILVVRHPTAKHPQTPTADHPDVYPAPSPGRTGHDVHDSRPARSGQSGGGPRPGHHRCRDRVRCFRARHSDRPANRRARCSNW